MPLLALPGLCTSVMCVRGSVQVQVYLLVHTSDHRRHCVSRVCVILLSKCGLQLRGGLPVSAVFNIHYSGRVPEFVCNLHSILHSMVCRLTYLAFQFGLLRPDFIWHGVFEVCRNTEEYGQDDILLQVILEGILILLLWSDAFAEEQIEDRHSTF